MPNHVTHRIVVTGPAADLTAFRDRCFVEQKDPQDGTPSVQFDFNRIIPMPDAIRDSESSSTVDFGLFVLSGGEHCRFGSPLTYPWAIEKGLHTIEQFRAWLEKTYPDAIPKAQQAVDNLAKYGHANWYDWAIAHWGTKWNAYSFDVASCEPERLEFMFATAWSSPSPIWRKLCELYPQLTFHVQAFDEGWGFAVDCSLHGDADQLECVDASDELHESVYGYPPYKDDDDDEDEEPSESPAQDGANEQ
jgi:hypothetical protein